MGPGSSLPSVSPPTMRILRWTCWTARWLGSPEPRFSQRKTDRFSRRQQIPDGLIRTAPASRMGISALHQDSKPPLDLLGQDCLEVLQRRAVELRVFGIK